MHCHFDDTMKATIAREELGVTGEPISQRRENGDVTTSDGP